MVNKKEAFSLVEAIVSMFIIGIVMMGSLTVLTKQKPKADVIAPRGQFACWYDDNGILHEEYMDERTSRGEKLITDKDYCTLVFDRKPSRYFIMATAAGLNGVRGQFKTEYTSSINSSQIVKPGKISAVPEAGKTEIYSINENNETEYTLIAETGVTAVGNNIIPYNIDEQNPCYLLSAGKPCHNSSSPAGAVQEGCEVRAVKEFLNQRPTYSILIKGCGQKIDVTTDLISQEYNESEYTHNTNYSGADDLPIYISDLQTTKQIPHLSTLRGQLENVLLSKNPYRFSKNGAEVLVNLNFKDSSFVANDNISISKMSQMINFVPHRRQSELTDKVKDVNAGAANKNGAVLILW